MNNFEKISIAVQVLTLIAASYIGIVQNQINTRQANLQDYVAIAASPDNTGTKITLLNTGRVNLYIDKIIVGDQTLNYDRPRLLATGTLESSYYWVSPPTALPLDKDFDLKVYVTDEFGTQWVSEHGGQVHEYATNDGKSKVRALNLWSYKTEKPN
jgi:hypothetical protein